ncbi:MAG: ATP-binding cassette domain-containing protein [Clostridiales bacterium]|jgi:ATPase subunit of ABC transporter with duplicated ATPase domains|nr:ATP-binding cassette domain-containing protein [Clostridiales bacterium]
MSLLKVKNITHAFGDNTLLNSISFDLNDGEKMGIVGANGAGKSTLLKILVGEASQDGGTVEWRPRISVGYLDQYAEIPQGHSVVSYLRTAFAALYAMEDRYNKLNLRISDNPEPRLVEQAAAIQQRLAESGFYELDSHIARVCAGLGITALGMDKMISKLSGGQRAKVILAKLLLEAPDVLIMDEPTNFLDKAHIEWLTRYLAGFKGAFIVVSHHFDFLDGITSCICEIEFHSIVKYRGNLTAYLSQKDIRKLQYINEYNAQRRIIEKAEDYIAKNKVRASTARLAKSREKMLDKIDHMPPPKELPKPGFRFICGWKGFGPMMEVRDLVIGYTGPLLPSLSFTMKWGQKLVITGFNGIGKTTLVKTILGEVPALSGGCWLHDNLSVGYFEQEPAWDDKGQTPYEYIASLYPALEKKQVMGALAKAGVTSKHFNQRLATLSGGEQAKVKICQLSLKTCNLLILDEPTNHLDAAAKTVLREALLDYPGGVILITHEAAFREGITGEVLELENR